ncbi:MAG: formate dehydrogenase accessory protein FdhE [Rubrivivax sp.]
MSATATVRVMTPEEIAASAGGETPWLRWPQRETVFAERRMRLAQLARGHAMEDFLRFMAEVARAQQVQLAAFPSVPLPDRAALARTAERGLPPLAAVDWPRDAAWRTALRALVADLRRDAAGPVAAALDRLAAADDDTLERQADCLLTGVTQGLDLASAPLVAAALQVYWTHLLLAVQKAQPGSAAPFGRPDDPGLCPCCGSRPVASITRTAGGALGQRYLHCSLCGLEWHMVRAKCSHCGESKSIAYQSLEVPGAEDAGARAAQAAVQAETCESCGHYLKILHADRDPMVDAVADDLASLTLDLLVAETGLQRHGHNLMLLFGEPEPPPPKEAS